MHGTERLMSIPGHCGFSLQEHVRAFDELVAWVRDGTKPPSDNVFGDLRNAALTFTTPLRPNDPEGLKITK